jgi:thioredoxin reductase
MMYDLIIIGAGPAGISAALYAARQKLNFLVITKDIGGLANFIPTLKTYLGWHYTTGFDMVQKFKEHLSDYKVPIKTGEAIRNISKAKAGFCVTTEKKDYFAKVVIIASGRRFKRLGLPSEKAYENKGLSYCAACDGPVFRNKTVAIIGGGRSGIFSALFMLSLAKKIYLIEKEPKIKDEPALREALRAINASKKVEIITGADTKEILGNKFVNSIRISRAGKKKVLSVRGIFVEIGYEPNTDFLKGFAKLNKRGEIVIDKNNMSSVRGMFAAGDVTDVPEKQVIVSVGEGAKATLSAIMYLDTINNK